MTDNEIIDIMAEKAYEAQEAKRDELLRNDYDAFYDFTQNEREEAVKAVKYLQKLHKMYGWEFDLKTFGDEL